MNYNMSVVGIVLIYWSKDGHESATEIRIPPEIFFIDLKDEYYNTHIDDGLFQKNIDFKSAKIQIIRKKYSSIPWSIDDAIDAIKDFLYKDKWDEAVFTFEFSGKHHVYQQNEFSVSFERKDLQILEISDKDKEDGVKLSFMFNK